ncbi:hypothetical protein [Nannocystis pusilla]|uniref:hypothetical protein n=1 Tax=Nannocystis pusilla TaxID=889268 RepID=UPI003B7AC074
MSVLFALVLAGAPCSDSCAGAARAICCQRREAHDRNDYPRMLELVDREVAVLRAERAAAAEPVEPGSLRGLCSPLEAAVYVCLDWRPDQDCARRYLDEYAATCLDDPVERLRYHNLSARHAFRRLDFAGALEHAAGAESAGRALWQAHEDDHLGQRGRLAVAASLSLRAELAVQLQRDDIVPALVAELDEILAPLTAAEWGAASPATTRRSAGRSCSRARPGGRCPTRCLASLGP